MSAARLLLIRHGQITANVTRHWHGSTDSPLTADGRRQAERTARHLLTRVERLDAVYASPLRRALDTAAPIERHHGLSLREEPLLREYSLGELEGAPYRALLEQHGFFQRVAEDPSYAPAGGESVLDVARRMQTALTRIATCHTGEAVAVIGHAASLAVAFAQFLDADPRAWTNYTVDNCSVSELVLQPTPRLIAFNDTAHL